MTAPDFTLDQLPSDPDINYPHEFGHEANLKYSRFDRAGVAGRNQNRNDLTGTTANTGLRIMLNKS